MWLAQHPPAALAACTGALAAPILWISDSGGRLGTVDVATGSTTVVGNMGRVMLDIAFDSMGNLWGISGGNLYSVNSATAVSTLVGATTGAGSINSLVFGPGGVLYAAGTSLYSLNTTTGAGTLIGAGSGYASSGDLAFVGGNLYLSSDPTANDSRGGSTRPSAQAPTLAPSASMRSSAWRHPTTSRCTG